MSVVNIFPTIKAVVQIRIMTKAIKDNSHLITIYVVSVLWSFKFPKVHLRRRQQKGCYWEDQMRPELPHGLTPQQWDLLSGHWVGAGASPTQDLPIPEADTTHSRPSRPCWTPVQTQLLWANCPDTEDMQCMDRAWGHSDPRWTSRVCIQLQFSHDPRCASSTPAQDAVGFFCHKGSCPVRPEWAPSS